MDKSKRTNILLIASIISFFIMSADFLLMPIGNDFTNRLRWLDILTGILFWSGFIAGAVIYVTYSRYCKGWYNENKGINDVYKNKKIGLITFFSNKAAMIADIAFFISIVLFAILMIFTDRTSYFCYITISILVFSFIMHCILNGKSYYVHQNLNKLINN